MTPQNVVDSLKPLSEMLVNDIHHTRYLLGQTATSSQHSSIQNHLAYNEKLLFELFNTLLPYYPSLSATPLMLDIIPLLIQASENIRAQIWSPTSGPHLLIMLLSKSDFTVNIKVISALITWLQLDTKPISKYLCEGENLNDLLKIVLESNYTDQVDYIQVFELIKLMILYGSSNIAQFIVSKPELVQRIINHIYSFHKLKLNSKTTQFLKTQLEIIALLIEKSGWMPSDFVKSYKLKRVLTKLVQKAVDDNLVIIQRL
jgi:hypothetical protein